MIIEIELIASRKEIAECYPLGMMITHQKKNVRSTPCLLSKLRSPAYQAT